MRCLASFVLPWESYSARNLLDKGDREKVNVADRVDRIPPYVFAKLGRRIRELTAEGKDIIRLDIPAQIAFFKLAGFHQS